MSNEAYWREKYEQLKAQRQFVAPVPLNIEDEYVRKYLWEHALIAIDDPCTRSHPHEDMNEYCQHKTELARIQNKEKNGE